MELISGYPSYGGADVPARDWCDEISDFRSAAEQTAARPAAHVCVVYRRLRPGRPYAVNVPPVPGRAYAWPERRRGVWAMECGRGGGPGGGAQDTTSHALNTNTASAKLHRPSRHTSGASVVTEVVRVGPSSDYGAEPSPTRCARSTLRHPEGRRIRLVTYTFPAARKAPP
ncbi:hypothetical protein GCM10018952_28110 [Streptosporangium vulgare]